ncbi:hypothetical protein ACFQ1S_31575 [Kibdelosporangium lantanae]|uniref:Uncharacterized protein n=1 Tax=Kibdelosporangium lantanae TaxID=1497396 RepID=A0ABW3MKY6_9PSEU
MPIRTDHGRNAALRQLLTWPLHSPHRLLATTTALAAASIAITIGINAVSTPPQPPPLVVSTEPPTTPRGQIIVPRSTSPAVLSDPQGVGRRFAEAWVTKTDTDSWRTHLRPMCTTEYAAAILPAIFLTKETDFWRFMFKEGPNVTLDSDIHICN